MMWKLFLSTILFASALAVAQEQTGSPAGIAMPAPPISAAATAPNGTTPESAAFRVRVLDGRTGAAIRDAHVKLWYDEPAGTGYVVGTDTRGYGLMPAPVGTPIRVLASPSDYVDCRKPDKGAPPEGFNLADIAKAGMQGQNTCGAVGVHTKPGELVLYVRSAHWYESINRDQRQ